MMLCAQCIREGKKMPRPMKMDFGVDWVSSASVVVGGDSMCSVHALEALKEAIKAQKRKP